MEFADLLEFLSNRAEAAVAPEDVGLYLQSHRDRFVNLLAYKVAAIIGRSTLRAVQKVDFDDETGSINFLRRARIQKHASRWSPSWL
jgi:hypothetical protein